MLTVTIYPLGHFQLNRADIKRKEGDFRMAVTSHRCPLAVLVVFVLLSEFLVI